MKSDGKIVYKFLDSTRIYLCTNVVTPTYIYIGYSIIFCILCKRSIVHFKVLSYLQMIQLVCKLYQLCLQQNLCTLVYYESIFMHLECCILCTFYYYTLIMHVEICRHNCCSLCNTVFSGTKNSSLLVFAQRLLSYSH